MRALEDTKDYYVMKAKSKKLRNKDRNLKYRQLCDGNSMLASCQETTPKS